MFERIIGTPKEIGDKVKDIVKNSDIEKLVRAFVSECPTSNKICVDIEMKEEVIPPRDHIHKTLGLYIRSCPECV